MFQETPGAYPIDFYIGFEREMWRNLPDELKEHCPVRIRMYSSISIEVLQRNVEELANGTPGPLSLDL